MIFDSHAHYYSDFFSEDRDELLLRMHNEQGVCGIVCPSEDLLTASECVELARKYDFIYAAVGIHPVYADTWDNSSAERLSGQTERNRSSPLLRSLNWRHVKKCPL